MNRGHALRWAALLALTTGVGSAAFAAAGGLGRPKTSAPVPLGEAEVLELDLAFFQARIARDSFAARDHAQLARVYLQRAQRSGMADADLARAEEHARRSLALRGAHNGEALQVLASSLMGRHRFLEARAAAERLVAWDSTSTSARALLGEIQIELGAYREAAHTFGTLLTVRTDLAVAPRYARWDEIRGRPAEARQLLRDALKEASGRHGIPRSQLAWFHWRLGDLALRNGRLGEAQGEFEHGLQEVPEDHRLLNGLARVAAARGRWKDAIALGERAIAASLDPATLGLLALSHEALGDRAGSAEYERAMSVAVSGQAGAMHRAWSLYLLDRGRSVPQILARAQEEIRTRPDVYGWDLLAWALYRSGKPSAALRAAERALGMGTRDASLYYHAGTAAAAAGERARATRWLEEALAINPRWHPTQPDEARATLRRLRSGRSVP